MAAPDMEVIKEIPGYKVILKAVLKSQIQQLVEQLASHTDEQSVILTASVSDGTLSHLGSDSGKSFLQDHEDIKSQFLGFCLKREHKRKQEEEQKKIEKEREEEMQRLQSFSPRNMGPRPSRFSSPRHEIHPVRLSRAVGGSIRGPGVRHEPYGLPRPRARSLNLGPQGQTFGGPPGLTRMPLNKEVIKVEPTDSDGSNQSAADVTSAQKQSEQSGSQPSSPSSVQTLDVKPEHADDNSTSANDASDMKFSDTQPAEGLGLDSDLSNLISGEQSGDQPTSSVSSDMDPDVNIKLEAISENDMELEITGVEPGMSSVDTSWAQNTAMGYDPSGATGNQADMQGQEGYKKESAGESKESDSTKSATDSEEIHKGTLVDTPCDSLTAQGDQAKDDQPGNVTDNARSEDKHETLESSKGTESHSGSCEQSRSQSDQSSAVNVKNGESKASSTLVHALQQSNGNEECSNEENDKQKCVLDVNSGLESKNRKMSLTENIVNNTTEVAISTDKDTPKDGEENTNNVNIPIPNLNISEETSSKEMESNDSVVCSNPLRNNPDTSVNENSEMIPDSPCPKPNQESVSANDIHSKVELQPKERAGENAILSDSETMSLTQIQENQTSLDSLNTVESKTTTASVQNTQFVDSKECSKVDNNELSSSIKNNLFSGTEVGCLDSTEESTKSNLNDESMSALEDGETSDNGTCATDNVSMDEDCEQDISEPEGTDQIDNASVGISHASSEVKGIDGESVSNAVSNFEANGIRPQALSCSESNSSIDSNLPGFREKTSIESESKVTEDSNQAGQIISLFSQITAGSDASNEDLIGLIRVKLNEEMAKMKAREISNDGQDPVESTNTYILNDNRPSIINTSMPDDVAAMSNNFEINKAHATTSAEMSSSQTNDHKSNIETGSATKSDTKCTDGVEQGENSNIKTNPKDIGGSAVGIEKDKESKDNTSNKQPTIPETDKTCKVVKQMTGDRSERGNTKGKAQPIVIDLDAEADIESNKTLIGRGEKTPVKQGRHNVRMTPNKTSGRAPRVLQSPGQMSGRVLQNVHKTPNKTSSTPSKKNFIENLIATGVPIIIPDDDEKTPKEQSNDLQTKIAAQQRHFREAMKGKENPTFGDLAETSGMSGSVPVYQFTPPRARPMQRFDISSPESLSYRPRPIAPKPSSPAAAVAQEAFTYQPLAPRRQLLPYPEQSQSNIQQSPKGPSQVRSDMRYAAQNTTLPQTSSSPVLQQFAEQPGQQYSGLPSQGYAVGTPSSPAYKVGQVTQEYQSGQSTQSYLGAGPSPLRQQLAQKSQLQHVMQNQQGKLSRQSLVDEANAQFGRQNRPIQPAGDATTPVKYFGQSPQMERYRPQRQYMVQGQTRRSVENSPQQLRHRLIAPLLPSPNKQPEKRDISGTLVIIDDDTPVASSAPRMEQVAKEQMSRKVQNTQNRSPSIERQEPRGLTLPLVIRDVQSIAPVTTNPKDPGENPVSSIRNDPSSKKVAVPQPPANVTIKQEPKDGFTDQVQTTSIGKQNTVPNKRERPVENPEERAKQRSNEPPLKKIKREPGLGDVADTIATTSQKEQETTKPSKMAMADTQENESPNTSKTSEIIPKADEPMRKQRRTRSDVVRSESCPSPGPSKEKSQDGTSVTSSKEKPEVVLDIDVDDADGYIRNIALEAGEKSDVAKPSKPSTAQAKDDSEKVKVKIEKDESSQSEGDQSGKSRKGADMSQKQFGCGDCGKTFNKKKSLSQHFKIHTRETPFECDVCGKHFSMKTSLKKHIYTHFDEKK